MFAAPAQQQPPLSTNSSSSSLSQDVTVIDGEGFGVEQVANQDAVRQDALEARDDHEHSQPISTSSSTTAVNDYISADKHATFSDLYKKFEEPATSPVNPEDPPPPPPVVESPYSAFSNSTKRLIVGIGALAAVFSPISSNIFVPAIPTLAEALGRSESDISQAVTIYLVFQAITPSFFGSMSDTFGRRPLYIMTLVIYLGANMGLALMPTSQYWLLLFLRALQATGGSAVISIGYGCISDVAAPRERGKYAAVIQAGSTTGPALGPLIGGILTETLGWRSVFWFLVIATCIALIPLVLFMPETLRSLVGDGSIPPPPLNTSPIVLIQKHNAARKAAAADSPPEPVEEFERPPRKPKQYQPFSTFAILATPEIICCFIFVSLLYLQYYCSLTLLSTALKDSYKFNEIKIGLAYLPLGLGTIISSQLNGRQLDYYYRKEEARVGGDYSSKPHQFKTELTRIRCLIPFAVCSCLATIGQGWCLEKHVHIAATLVFNFFVGLGSGTVGSITVYAQDVKPGKGGAVSAAFNLVRCMFAAIAVACVQTMYSVMGAGWTFVLLTGLVIAGSPLPIITVFKGKQWRDKRKERKEARKARKAEKEEEKQAGVRN
ncbi:hypothetical protein IAR50_007469 [Cryptococcus sp. DSM 104548]